MAENSEDRFRADEIADPNGDKRKSVETRDAEREDSDNRRSALPDQSPSQRPCPIKVTFTRRAERGFIGKRWVSKGALEVVAEGVEWIDEEIERDDLAGVAREVKARGATGEWSVSLGCPAPGLDPLKPHRHAAEFYTDAPSRLFWLDIDCLRTSGTLGIADKLADAANYVVSLMPEEFRKVERFVMRTAKTGSNPHSISVRIVFLLDQPRMLAEMKAVAKGLAALSAFSRKSKADHKVIDTGLYAPGHHVFISAPQCAPGVTDPGATARMFRRDGVVLDLAAAATSLSVNLARAARRAKSAAGPGAPVADQSRLLDVPEDRREGLLRALVAALPNDLADDDRNGWIGHLHAIHGACGGAPYGREIALDFSARWSNGVDDPAASARAYDTLPQGEKGADYLIGRAVNVGPPGARAAVAAIDQARRDALEFPPWSEDGASGDKPPGDQPPGDAPAPPLPVDPIIAAMNEEWAFIKARPGGVLNLKTLRMWKWEEFKSYYANQFTPGDGKRKVTLAERWRAHPHRRGHEDVGLYPKNLTPRGCFNLFDGLAVEPKQGAWPKFEDYLRNVICDSDLKAFEALRNLIYWKVQNPTEPPEVAVALIGPPGVGKTRVGETLGRMFGKNRFVHHMNPEAAASHFNAELEGAVLVLFDECFFGHNQSVKGRIKSLVTSRTLMIERKGFDRYQAKNSLMVMFASNEAAALPIDNDDRRVLVLNVSDAHAQDHAYFADLDATLDGGELAAFVDDALAADLSGYNRRALFRTEARSELAAATASPEAEFIRLFLEDGRLPGNLWPRGQRSPDMSNPWVTGEVALDGDAMHDRYISFMDARHKGKPRRNRGEVCGEFRRALGRGLFRSQQMKVPGGGGKRASRFIIGSLADCRGAYDKRHGRTLEWPDPRVTVGPDARATGSRFGQEIVPLDENDEEWI
jgi:hypothetical protein